MPAVASSLDQLPETRRAIVVELKSRGSATIADLAQHLRMTGEAVRQQLIQLHRDGWVETRVEREEGKAGRPSTAYVLTVAGEHLFPKHYDALALTVIDAVAERLGPEALEKVLVALAEERIASWEPRVRGLPLAEKIQALKSVYLQDDPYMEVERSGSTLRLVERNCPFLNTAMRRPALCSVTVHALTRLLGVRVVREERFQNGDGRCVFRVLQDRPIDPKRTRFALEVAQDPPAKR